MSEANGNGFGDDETTNGSGGPCADADNCDKNVESNNPFYMHNTGRSILFNCICFTPRVKKNIIKLMGVSHTHLENSLKLPGTDRFSAALSEI